MTFQQLARGGLLAGLLIALAGCGGSGSLGLRGTLSPSGKQAAADSASQLRGSDRVDTRQSTLWDLFSNADDPNTTVEVNKYIWNAALDVLNFLPIEAADPFSGVIVTGYGTPPGGGRAYRATIYVQDPALDARSLKLALATRSGPASPETVRAVEDAILTRARQLRIADGKL